MSSVGDSFGQLFLQARNGIYSLSKRLPHGCVSRRVEESEVDMERQMSFPDSLRSPVSCTEYHDISDAEDLENCASLDAQANDKVFVLFANLVAETVSLPAISRTHMTPVQTVLGEFGIPSAWENAPRTFSSVTPPSLEPSVPRSSVELPLQIVPMILAQGSAEASHFPQGLGAEGPPKIPQCMDFCEFEGAPQVRRKIRHVSFFVHRTPAV